MKTRKLSQGLELALDDDGVFWLLFTPKDSEKSSRFNLSAQHGDPKRQAAADLTLVWAREQMRPRAERRAKPKKRRKAPTKGRVV